MHDMLGLHAYVAGYSFLFSALTENRDSSPREISQGCDRMFNSLDEDENTALHLLVREQSARVTEPPHHELLTADPVWGLGTDSLVLIQLDAHIFPNNDIRAKCVHESLGHLNTMLWDVLNKANQEAPARSMDPRLEGSVDIERDVLGAHWVSNTADVDVLGIQIRHRFMREGRHIPAPSDACFDLLGIAQATVDTTVPRICIMTPNGQANLAVTSAHLPVLQQKETYD